MKAPVYEADLLITALNAAASCVTVLLCVAPRAFAHNHILLVNSV